MQVTLVYNGIGDCIMYKLKDSSIKPIAHAFRTLLPTEKNYSVIEKVSLFALKCHRFVHGRGFTLQTDNKPFCGPKKAYRPKQLIGSCDGEPPY